MSIKGGKGKTHFLPRGLTYRKREQGTRKWVGIDVTAFIPPDQVDETNPFQVEMNFMSAKRHTQIFTPVGFARTDEEKVRALALAQATFADELLNDWRGFTIPVHNAIVRAEHVLECEDPDDPEAVAEWNRYFVEGIPFDKEFAKSVYANAEADRFQNLLVKALGAFHDRAEKIVAEGKADSPTSAVA